MHDNETTTHPDISYYDEGEHSKEAPSFGCSAPQPWNCEDERNMLCVHRVEGYACAFFERHM